MLSGTGQARAAPLKSLLYNSLLARQNIWSGPVGRAGCPRGADNFGSGCDAILCGGIGAFFVEEQQLSLSTQKRHYPIKNQLRKEPRGIVSPGLFFIVLIP